MTVVDYECSGSIIVAREGLLESCPFILSGLPTDGLSLTMIVKLPEGQLPSYSAHGLQWKATI